MRVCVSVSVSVFESVCVCVRVFYCIRLCVGWFSALLCLCVCVFLRVSGLLLLFSNETFERFHVYCFVCVCFEICVCECL